MPRRQDQLFAIGHRDPNQTLAHPECGLEGVGEAGSHPIANRQPIDHHLDRVPAVLVQIGGRGGINELAIDPGADKTLADHLAEKLAVLALALVDQWCEQHEPGAFAEGRELIHHLLDRLWLDRDLAVGTERYADGRPQQPQVVVDLGHRSHRRAWVARSGLLLDGDRRRQSFNGVHIRFLHLVEKLACVGRQRFHITPLAFGKERVEGKRRLARPRNPGDHHQPVSRDGDIDIVEVVLACAADDDVVPHQFAASSVVLFDDHRILAENGHP